MILGLPYMVIKLLNNDILELLYSVIKLLNNDILIAIYFFGTILILLSAMF